MIARWAACVCNLVSRASQETLKARAASAKSSLAIQEMIGGLRSTSSSSFAAFEKMEEKVRYMVHIHMRTHRHAHTCSHW